MHFKLVLLFAVVGLWDKVNSRSCNCGLGAGGDVCSGGGLGSVSGVINGGSSSSGDACQPLVVRPQTLPTIDLNSYSKPRVVCKTVGSSVHTLKPIGGLCTCGKTIIKPAVIPKPNCAACAEGGTVSISGSGSSSSASESSHTHHYHHHHQITGSAINIPNLQFPACGLPVLPQAPSVAQAPADAVSLAIALQRKQQRNDAVERQLQFGFKSLPKEICVVKKEAFPEERLYRINGEVLELKKNYEGSNVDEEALEELEIEDEPETIVPSPSISLGSLGYGPAKTSTGHFVSLISQQPSCSAASDTLTGTLSGGCNDGYQGGQVIIKQGAVSSQVVIPQAPQIPCDDGSDGRYYQSPSLRYNSPSYTYSASSASRNANNQQSSVFFQKLGC